MITNLEKYIKDLDRLIKDGQFLLLALQNECHPEEFEKLYKEVLKDDYNEIKSKLPSFGSNYQSWYSESLVLIKQILPDRLEDFKKYYEKPKITRKEIKYGNYVIEDALQKLRITKFGEIVVNFSAAIPQFEQQLNIVKSVKNRFESSLFDIKQLVQADLFDHELKSAQELLKKGFLRGAGAIAGVVLEKHLLQVCENHNLNPSKKNPSISDHNDQLKLAQVYETPTRRKIQHLGDLRNLCDHNKERDPSKEDVTDLIEGVEKIIKTLF